MQIRRRRLRQAAALAALPLVVGAVATTRSTSGAPDRSVAGQSHLNRFEFRDPDRGRENRGNTPTAELYSDRAYPRGYVTSDQVQRARAAYLALPKRLSRGDFRPSARAVANPGVGAAWSLIGPTVGLAPGATTESLKDSITSGRITALAVDPNCGAPGHGCRLWVAAAGGGVWRTTDALATTPQWTPLENGLPTNAFGSLIVDPTDRSGNTLYAGTGEANAINQAGLGLFKTVDGGDHWAPVGDSASVAKDRSIGAIAVDPRDNRHLYMGTDLGTEGQSSVNGGAAEPPGAPQMGLYESTDGGATWTLALGLPSAPGLSAGGVTHIELDPNDPDTVYAAAFAYGIWRRSAPGDDFEQIYQPIDGPDVDPFDRTEFSTVDDGATTRMYVGDGGFDADGNVVGDFFRSDDAAGLPGNAADNSAWTKLSSPVNGTPGFASYQLCQGQCSYDLFVQADPSNPDVVWFGGSMVYEEIRPLQDQSLIGVAPNRSNGRAVMRSQDAGVHFTDMTADSTGSPEPVSHTHYEQMHPDQHAIAFAPGDHDIAFVGSDGGLVRTDGQWADRSGECAQRDGLRPADHPDPADLADCRQWLSKIPHQLINLNAGLATLQFVSLTSDPRDPDGDLLGGTQDNGTFAFSSLAAGQPRTWFESVNGDGSASGFDVGDPNVRYHTYFLGAGDINHHGADPDTWSFITQPVVDSGEAVSFYTPVQVDPKVSGTIYLGAQHVWRTKDDGGDGAALLQHCAAPGGVPEYDGTMRCGDFVPIGPDLTAGTDDRAGSYIAAVQRAPSDTGTLWAATRRGRLFVSKNADDPDPARVAFDRLDTARTPRRFISGIAVDPNDPNHAWITYSGYNAATPGTPGHVFEVRYTPQPGPNPGSATFTDISYNLADQPVTDIVRDDETGDLYSANDYGVARLPAGATAWERVSDGLPLASVPGLTMRADGRELYAATYGRSAYRLALAPVARISGPDSVRAGDLATFDGRASHAYQHAPLSYAWTFPDGTTATGPVVSWRATGSGGTVRLTVTASSDNRQATATKTITVTSVQGGGGGGGTPPPKGLVQLLTRKASVRSNRTVRLKLACPKTQTAGCSGTLALSVKVRRHRRALGRAHFSLRAGATKTVTVRLSRSVLRALRAHRRVSVRVVLRQSQKNPGGPRTRTKTIRLVLRR